MWCMLSYKDKKLVEDFVGQLINVKLKLIILNTLLLIQISVYFVLLRWLCSVNKIKLLEIESHL